MLIKLFQLYDQLLSIISYNAFDVAFMFFLHEQLFNEPFSS